MKTVSTYSMAKCKHCESIFNETDEEKCPKCGSNPQEGWQHPLEETMDEHLTRIAKEAATATYTDQSSAHLYDWVMKNDHVEDTYLPDGVDCKALYEGTWICNMAHMMRISYETTLGALQSLNDADINDPDRICISWHVDDVKGRSEDRGGSITNQQAREILDALDRQHDACIGVSWDTIDAHLDNPPEGGQ